MMLTTFVVGVFYSLDALYGGTSRSQHTVLEVAAGFRSDDRALEGDHSGGDPPAGHASRSPLLMQWIMLLVSTAVLLGNGLSAAPLWTDASLLQKWLMLLYHFLTVHGLWYAPIYGWLLLVSAWARRAPFFGPACRCLRSAWSRRLRSTPGISARWWLAACSVAGQARTSS